jgi:hypothetical protein
MTLDVKNRLRKNFGVFHKFENIFYRDIHRVINNFIRILKFLT